MPPTTVWPPEALLYSIVGDQVLLAANGVEVAVCCVLIVPEPLVEERVPVNVFVPMLSTALLFTAKAAFTTKLPVALSVPPVLLMVRLL